MCIEGKVVGALNIVSKSPRKFTEKDVETLSVFADQAAIAIENARLFKDLKETREELEKSGMHLKKFSRKILSIREEEKKKISRNLHDEFGSLEFAIHSSLSIAEKEIKDKNLDKALHNIRIIKAILDEASMNFKKMAADLRPVDFDFIGLPNALRDYISNASKQSKLNVDLKIDVNEKTLNDEIAIVLYRVAQEAFNNINKHAQASEVKVRLSYENGNMKFKISDNGKGFDLGKGLQQRGKLLKMGITGMRERVESLNGTLNINSAPHKGTTILISLPLNKKGE
jgi:two-component system sensor histidine kinase DegS